MGLDRTDWQGIHLTPKAPRLPTKGKLNRGTWVNYVANYAVKYFDCSECGAKPHEACTLPARTRDGVIVCLSRWLAARAEVKDPARRRPYRRDTVRSRLPKPTGPQCPVCGNPSDGWCDPCKSRAFTDSPSPAYQYRKLRKFLSSHGITLARDYGTDRYLLDYNGKRVTGPVPLDAVIGAVENHWETLTANVQASVKC